MKVQVEPEKRKKIVILGSGWAAVNVFSKINPNAFDVTVVSPNNYFLFTPLLPSAVVGSLQPSSIIQPARKFYKVLQDSKIQFYEAECTNIDHENNIVTCSDSSPVCTKSSTFDLEYDYLVIAVGSEPNTFNTKGVKENAFFVKSIEDARSLRNHIVDCIETANLPSTTEEERKRLLHFVIVGGGPTGVETAAEINDFMEEDISRYYPQLHKDIKVSLIQSSEHLLNTYSEAISEKTKAAFQRQNINVIFNSRVKSVEETEIQVFDKISKESYDLPYGTCVWSTGISLTPLTNNFIKSIEEQKNRRAITTDEYFRVKGNKMQYFLKFSSILIIMYILSGKSNIFAIGDCSTIEQNRMLRKAVELFEVADTDGDGSLSVEEFEFFCRVVSNEYPQMKVHINNAAHLFEQFDANSDNGNIETFISIFLSHTFIFLRTFIG